VAFLSRWIGDPNAHVRRLVSEGTRLRLPWAPRVGWLDANPERVLALLDRLKDDPATLVRRSVANNLNDLGKVHPTLLSRTATAWLDGASAERRALIEHALRSALKRGEPDALRILGYGRKPAIKVEQLRVDPSIVRIGQRVNVSFKLRSSARNSDNLVVDLVCHFVKASGRTSPKVFRVKRMNLAPRDVVLLGRSISLAVHTTRKPQPGRHVIEIVVNGSVLRRGSFEVRGNSKRRTSVRTRQRTKQRTSF
jgi:3-methyladenine DNA glycosylase AlkC